MSTSWGSPAVLFPAGQAVAGGQKLPDQRLISSSCSAQDRPSSSNLAHTSYELPVVLSLNKRMCDRLVTSTPVCGSACLLRLNEAQVLRVPDAQLRLPEHRRTAG
jgi:hypothetical protein